MTKSFAMICVYFVFFCDLSLATEVENKKNESGPDKEKVILAFKNLGTSLESDEIEKISLTPQYSIKINRMLGEGGEENYEYVYRKQDKTLEKLNSTYNYVSHTQGLNKKYFIKSVREFSKDGKNIKVNGQYEVRYLDSDKIIEKRKISNPNDPALKDQMPPLLVFPFYHLSSCESVLVRIRTLVDF